MFPIFSNDLAPQPVHWCHLENMQTSNHTLPQDLPNFAMRKLSRLFCERRNFARGPLFLLKKNIGSGYHGPKKTETFRLKGEVSGTEVPRWISCFQRNNFNMQTAKALNAARGPIMVPYIMVPRKNDPVHMLTLGLIYLCCRKL